MGVERDLIRISRGLKGLKEDSKRLKYDSALQDGNENEKNYRSSLPWSQS
jgi:hypothetical protein